MLVGRVQPRSLAALLRESPAQEGSEASCGAKKRIKKLAATAY